MPKLITLTEQLREDSKRHPEARDVPGVIDRIALAASAISRELGRAGIVDILGSTGEINGHGEAVRKLDVLAHDTIVSLIEDSGLVAAMASEESEEIIPCPGCAEGELLLLFDPLDGSSNIDANVSVGTIFSILGAKSSGTSPKLEDFLRPGTDQIAAGYVVYGPSTMLVYTMGNGVHGFTLDRGRDEFILTHPGIQTPRRGEIFSVNLGNHERFEGTLRRYIAHLASTRNHRAKPYSLRYIGSLVSDFHRNLLYGGIFLYPGDSKSRAGKLRLLYEASPLAMIAEQAGGRASNGAEEILRVRPTRLHQRVPLFIGSADDVAEAEAFLAGGFASISASSIGIA